MNYVKHMNHFMELVAVDDRLTANHICIYLALFQLWNKSRFPDHLRVCRNEVLGIGKIGSSKTYYKCLHDLHEYGYILYRPSHNPLKGSVIEIIDLSELPDESEKDDETEPKKKVIPSEKNLFAKTVTRVGHEKNKHGSRGKNDSSASQQVTPLFINNINLINSKQRERRAHEKKISVSDFYKKKPIPIDRSGIVAGERKKEGAAGLSPKSVSLPALRSVSSLKKDIARNFTAPTQDELKAFFAAMRIVLPSGELCDSAALACEAGKFYDHFESNGWLVGGKSPMRNWKAACRSWAAKIPYFTKTQRKQSVFDRLNAETVLDYSVPF